MPSEYIGIIDLGSNSSRLVIYEIFANGAYRPVYELKRDIRLAQYLDEQNQMSEEGIARAVQCITTFRRVGELYDVSHWLAVATAAVRQAVNQAEILHAIQQTTGIEFRILDGEQEGRYGYLGVINTLDIQDGLLVDIGGASTELMHVRGRQLRQVHSLPFGVVNLTRQFQSVSEFEQGDAILRFMQNQFETIRWLAELQHLPLIGLGGTARAIGKLNLTAADRSPKRLHGYQVQRETIRDLYRQMKSTTSKQRKRIKGVSKQRLDILLAGISTLEALAMQISTDRLLISRNGVRQGLFYEYLFRNQQTSVVESVLDHHLANFQKLFGVNQKLSAQITFLALHLFDSLYSIHGLSLYERKVLYAATQIEGGGTSINTERCGKHSAYLAAYSYLYGLNQVEVEELVQILTNGKSLTAKKLSVLIRLAKYFVLQVGVQPQIAACQVTQDTVQILVQPASQLTLTVVEEPELHEDFKKIFQKKLLIHTNGGSQAFFRQPKL